MIKPKKDRKYLETEHRRLTEELSKLKPGTEEYAKINSERQKIKSDLNTEKKIKSDRGSAREKGLIASATVFGVTLLEQKWGVLLRGGKAVLSAVTRVL